MLAIFGPAFLVAAPTFLLRTQEGTPHVVFVVGEGEYQSQQTMPALAERLEEAFGWRTTVLIDEELHAGDDNHVEGLAALNDADLAVLYLRFRRWPQSDLDALQRYVDRGGAIFGFRTSTHAFAYEDDDPRAGHNAFGAETLGAPWIFHYGHDSATRARVVAEDAPVLDGVDDSFEVRSWTYHVRPDYPPADARVLIVGDPLVPASREERPGPEASNPIAWTRTHPGDGRVFMTTMGHPEDFHVASFRRLIGNGMHWALDLPMPAATLDDLPEITHPDDEDERDAPWERMDYGPFLSTAIAIGDDVAPVHKGVVIPVRGVDGEETGLYAVFDTDLLAMRCVWRGDIALRGIVFDGPHGVFPQMRGQVIARNDAQPGIIVSDDAGDPRTEPWGPVPARVGHWRGIQLDGPDIVLRYESEGGATDICERVYAYEQDGEPVFVREFLTTSRDGVERGPTIRLFDPKSTAHSNVGDATITLPTNGTLRVAIPRGSSLSDEIPEAAKPFKALLNEHRPRWGDAIITEGVLDERFGEGEVERVVRFEAEAARTAIEIARADDGVLDLSEGVVLTSPRRRDPDHWFASVPPEDRLGWWPVGDTATERERNAFTGRADLLLDGVTWRRGVVGRAIDFDGTAAAWLDDLALDFAHEDATVAAWIQTTKDGTVFSQGPRSGPWAPDGVALFVRNGRLAFDVGWVGVVSGGPELTDGGWHHVAATWRAEGGRVRLFVDGERVASGDLELRGEPQDGFAFRFGWTNDDFPESPRFSGYMDGPTVLREALDDALIPDVAAATGEPIVEGTVVAPASETATVPRLSRSDDGSSVRLLPPPSGAAAEYEVRRRRGPRAAVLAWASSTLDEQRRGPAFRIDRITWPAENRYDSWMRFGAFDFVPHDQERGPDAAVISTWSGDLWRVDGLDEDLEVLRWQRMATGLNQPFGVVCQDPSTTLVLGRDQITQAVDVDLDGEVDRLECWSNALHNSEHFHEPASGLVAEPDGSFVVIKAARHAKQALHDHHGAIVRVEPSGAATILARGFRAPMGLTVLPDGTMLASDQEGHWMPANRINLVRPNAESPPFYGNGWAARNAPFEREIRGGESVQQPWPSDLEPEPPLCWIHPSVDRSPSSQVIAAHPVWGPLEGAILGLSYGTGEVYLVLRQDIERDGGALITQGGIVKLGVQLPTGLLHGRIHPTTGDLYVCGLFGWSSDRTEPGGFYRVRPQPARWTESLNIPTSIRATTDGIELTFLAPLDAASVADPANWSVSAWNYRRSSDYGSPTFDLEGNVGQRTTLSTDSATLSPDGLTAHLAIPGLRPCMQLQLDWRIRDASGRRLEHAAHLTLHALERH